jgi:hypothetical protein
MTAHMDEIAIIARDYFDQHKAHAFMLVDDQISMALGKSEWEAALKWYRVRHRLRRLQMLYAGGKASGLAH